MFIDLYLISNWFVVLFSFIVIGRHCIALDLILRRSIENGTGLGVSRVTHVHVQC